MDLFLVWKSLWTDSTFKPPCDDIGIHWTDFPKEIVGATTTEYIILPIILEDITFGTHRRWHHRRWMHRIRD
jgi:hypothetical protein